jgi:hypothetical protein
VRRNMLVLDRGLGKCVAWKLCFDAVCVARRIKIARPRGSVHKVCGLVSWPRLGQCRWRGFRGHGSAFLGV